MLMLLPPSETKRAGGSGVPLVVGALAFPAASAPRTAALDALGRLAEDPDAMVRTLKLSPRQTGAVDVNREVLTSPTMPALDRFTGVLYDALDSASLPAPARGWLGAHAAIQTALLGPVGALDEIPSYRLSAGHRLPGLPPLTRHWASADAFAGVTGPFVDLRSEAYRSLSPIPAAAEQAFVRVVATGPDGEVRALNHFNKKTKGVFVRALALDAPRIRSIGDLLDWATGAGFSLRWNQSRTELLLGARD